MLYFYQLGDKVIQWFTAIAKVFTLPMNSPDFQNLVFGSTGVRALDVLLTPGRLIVEPLFSLFGSLTFLEFIMSNFILLFFTITIVKWVLPTS